MFWTPAEAVAFSEGDLVPAMDKVRNFLFTHGLLGDNAPSADVVGIEFADGKIIGDKNNVKFRFTDKYVKLAAEGKL
jgi:NitT/TauT family transport system substrate-binding protein